MKKLTFMTAMFIASLLFLHNQAVGGAPLSETLGRRFLETARPLCRPLDKLVQENSDVAITTNSIFLNVHFASGAGNAQTNFSYTFCASDTMRPLAVTVVDVNTNGFDISYYPGGQVKRYCELAKSEWDGPAVIFFENGHVKTYGEFRNRCVEGRYCEFDETGKTIHDEILAKPIPLRLRL